MKQLLSILTHNVLALLTLGLAVACNNADAPLPDDAPPFTGETTTLTLRIPALGSTTTRADGTDRTRVENTIKTLRVLIMPAGAWVDGYPSVNKLFTKADLTWSDPTTENDGATTVTISDVPVGTMRIHVIANEAAMGRNYTELSTFNADITDHYESGIDHPKLCITNDPATEFFPKRWKEMNDLPDDELLGLPMGWQNLEQKITPEMAPINVALERAVAKINVNMTNTLTSEINITQMEFGAFFSNQLYLFRESNLDIPSTATYSPITYTGSGTDGILATIPAANDETTTTMTLTLYAYPSNAWKDSEQPTPYAIGFMTKKTTYPLQAFVTKTDYSRLNSIIRNTIVNINATFRATSAQIDFSVEPWTSHTVDVPPFE